MSGVFIDDIDEDRYVVEPERWAEAMGTPTGLMLFVNPVNDAEWISCEGDDLVEVRR